MSRNIQRLILTLLLTVLTAAGCTLIRPEPPQEPPVIPDATELPEILLNGKPISVVPSPVMIKSQLYFPFKEIMPILHIDSKTYEDPAALVAYHDNRFLKAELETMSLWVNGRKVSDSAGPLLIGETLYAPADQIIKAFHLKVNYPDAATMDILHLDNEQDTTLIDGEYFVRVEDKASDVVFSVPQTWERLPGSPFRFGLDSEFENYSVTFRTEPLGDKTPEALMEALRLQTGNDLGYNLEPLSTNAIQVNGLDGLASVFEAEDLSTPGKVLVFLYHTKDTAYIFEGRYSTVLDESSMERLITGIARSLRLGDMAVDVQREHYYEAPAWFDEGIRLESPLYSNMEVRGQLQVRGTVRGRVSTLFAVVSKGSDTLTFQIPVKDKRFDGTLYFPFGLGKHDITLYASQKTMEPSDRALQVSLINTSAREARWLVPSPVIDLDSEYISSQSSLLTYKIFGDYGRARHIFLWVIETLRLQDSQRAPKAASQVYLAEKGSEAEIAALYAALLRSAEIPARVIKSDAPETHYWVQMQVNGAWLDSDPIEGIRKIHAGELSETAADAHFNMSRAYFDEHYTQYEALPW